MLKYLKKYWFYCLIAPLFMLGELMMDLLQPAMMATIVDDGVLKGDMQVIIKEGLLMLGLVVFGGTCGILCGVFANIASQRFGNDVRKDMFAKLMDFSFEQTERFTTGSLVTRITNDVSQVEQMVMMSVRSLVRCVVMFLGGIIMLYLQSPTFALIVLAALPFVVFFVVFFLKKVSPLYTLIQQKLDRINCLMQENIAGARVVKAYVQEDQELKTFARANDSLCDTNLKAQGMLAFLNPLVNIILNLCVAAVLYAGGRSLRLGGNISPGQTMAAITYLSLILMRVIFMANIFQTFTRAMASWKRIEEVLHTEASLAQELPENRPAALNRSGLGTDTGSDTSTGAYADTGIEYTAAPAPAVEFRHVNFAYPDIPDSPVLDDVSFSAKPGQTLAIIGSTGSGKSSLVSLIPRFYDAVSGTVLVDGKNVREYSLQDLRDKIGFVFQSPELFSRSIADNIRWGYEEEPENEKTAESMRDSEKRRDLKSPGSKNLQNPEPSLQQAARIAQAEEFILRMPDQYSSQVSESGHSLSGGQKQRLSIARALIRKPEILILDDASSALDLHTEANLYADMNKSMKDTTKIIVAQRIASVQNADQILVLENGKIAGRGTHDELLRTCQIYQEIYSSQLKKGS